METETSMIVATSLSKKYESIEAVHNLSLSIGTGRCFGLVGPNGAGKSTTVKMMTGIISPTSGSVQINGIDFERRPVEVKRHIGVVPEGIALFEGLTGEEHLRFVGRIHMLSKEEISIRIEELLRVLELEDSAVRLIETYSTGMKKKLSFAAAIIHRPKVLFLDEPLESVDPISRKLMKDLLLQMKNKGVTIFLTSHALDTIESFCDEVAIITKGRLVFHSKTEDIRKKIKNEISRETYQSLEEIFLDVVSDNGRDKMPGKLSWL